MVEIVSEKYHIRGVANSKQGGRPENQDDMGFVDTPLGFLIVVCDGMGGGPGGKTASYIVKYEIMTELCNCNPQASRMDSLKIAINKANDALHQKMKQVPELNGMGSTLVAILLNDQSALIAHLGDSRCYKVRGNRVLFKTNDHSLVGELVRNNALTEEQARTSPQSNVITRGLGSLSNDVPEFDEVAYQTGDRFVICTDGIWGSMPHDNLVKRFTATQDVDFIVSNLSDEVDKIGFSGGGGHDNHTLVMVEMKTDSILKDKMSKTTKVIFAILGCLLGLSLAFNAFCLIKLGTGPQKSAIKKAQLEIERLKPYELFYKASQDKNESSTYGVIKSLTEEKVLLMEENDSLREALQGLSSQLDSIKKDLDKRKVASQPVPAAVKQQEKNADSNVSGSPQVLAQRIINQFETMKQVTGKSVTEASHKKEACRSKILNLLLKLNELTKNRYKARLDAVKQNVSGNSPVMYVAENKEGTFTSTSSANRHIDIMKKKMQEVLNEIKK